MGDRQAHLPTRLRRATRNSMAQVEKRQVLPMSYSCWATMNTAMWTYHDWCLYEDTLFSRAAKLMPKSSQGSMVP
eukprot:3495185-Pleurochrysis_carterae.AAC.2